MKLTSRKFWLSVVTALCGLFLGITGTVDWELAITIITGALGTYVGLEGIADVASRIISAKTKKEGST